MPFYMVGQTGVPFGIIDVQVLPISAAQLDGQSGFFYRNAANLTGEANLSGTFHGSLSGTASNAALFDNQHSSYFRNGANMTGTINATQLNNESAAYYRNIANSTGIAQLSGSFTGSFAGTASNADLLDNLDSTYFRNGANLTGTINATQLDSQSAAYYRNIANATGTASLSGTFSGIFRANASTTGNASINLPHGTAPTSPVNGDIWTTNSGLFARISGSTVGPYSTGGGSASEGAGGTLYLWESAY